MINFQWLDTDAIARFCNIFKIMLNEIRKREIAFGRFSEDSLSLEESKNNLLGSIDLREKSRLHH